MSSLQAVKRRAPLNMGYKMGYSEAVAGAPHQGEKHNPKCHVLLLRVLCGS